MWRPLVILVLAHAGCTGLDCGSAEYVAGGEAAARWDQDADGRVDLIERCGTLYGSFGLRRTDLGLTTITLQPDLPNRDFEESLEVATLLLPAATMTFYTSHLTEGATIGVDQIGGAGLHKISGDAAPGYNTYALFEATITVIEGPGRVPGSFEDDDAERWRLRWDATYGDPQNLSVLQEWHAEDVIDVTNGTNIGDELGYPPDWTGPP